MKGVGIGPSSFPKEDLEEEGCRLEEGREGKRTVRKIGERSRSELFRPDEDCGLGVREERTEVGASR